MLYKCVLVCPSDTHDPIPLPHQEPVVLGRSPVTKVADKKCSRQQVELTADCNARTVTVKQLGSNPCGIGDNSLDKGESGVLKDGQTLHLVLDKYPNILKFEKKEESVSHAKRNIKDYFGGDKSKNDRDKSTKRSVDTDDSPSRKRLKIESSDVGEKTKGTDDSDNDSSDSEHMRTVKEKLSHLKAEMKKSVAVGNQEETASPKKIEAKTGSAATESKWEDHGGLVMFTSKGVKASYKIAAFDIDHTIITTKSGKVFPTHTGDWKIMFSEIPGKLKKLSEDKYKIAFFTNQSGIKRGKLKLTDFQTKVTNIITELGVPVQVFISTGPGPFRKPGLGMWRYLVDQANDGIEVDVTKSMYIGDAAGRPLNWAPGRKKDFSCSDRLFAINAGISFQTPEEYFLGYRKADFKMPAFDPRQLKSDAPLCSPATAKINSDSQEVVVSVGFPASGKTFFAKEFMVSKGYAHVNRDTLGTWQKCVEASKAALRAGKSVMVDNTNPDVESRNRYVECARAAGVPCRCFLFTASVDQARHNERFRELIDKEHKPINDMIIHSYKSKFTEPKLSEGFTEIVKINFVPKFKDKSLEAKFRHFLLDK